MKNKWLNGKMVLEVLAIGMLFMGAAYADSIGRSTGTPELSPEVLSGGEMGGGGSGSMDMGCTGMGMGNGGCNDMMGAGCCKGNTMTKEECEYSGHSCCGNGTGSGDDLMGCTGMGMGGDCCNKNGMTKDCDRNHSCCDEVTEIPEFPTVAIPAILALGGYLVIRARRRKE
jgi:hypothetical protein